MARPRPAGQAETDDPSPTAMPRAVERYLQADMAIIPIPPRAKAPNRRGWQNERFSIEDIPRLWNNGQNAGVLLGAPSEGLCDVDLDSPEAIAVAPHLLPATRTSGRPGKPHSHRWYSTDPVPNTTVFRLSGKGDGRSVVELRSTGAQSLVPPSLHPSGEHYSWESQEEITEIDGAELLEQSRDVATAALLLRYYPGEGSRHDYVLAAAGFLGRHLEPVRVERIMGAVVAAAGDEEAESRARDVRDTLEKIGSGLAATGGPTLDRLAPGVPDHLRRWHHWSSAEPEQVTMGVNALLTKRVLLGRDIERGIEPPEEIEPGVLLKGGVHQIFAGPGAGKTWLALWLAARSIERGERVLFLDMENGRRIVAERLGALGVNTSNMDELLFYIPSPTLATPSQSSAAYAELLDMVRPDLIVFDSWINFLASAQLDENVAGDIASWAITYTHPARDRGITVVLLDHVPHTANHARGSTRKKDEVDVQFRLSRRRPFDRDQVGEIMLHREKDREGWLPASVRFTVGSRGEGFVFRRSGAGAGELPGRDALKKQQRKSFEVLCSFGERGAGFNEWHRAAGVARSTLSKAAKLLMDMGLARQDEDKKYRADPAYCGSGTYGSVNHYRTGPNSGERVRSGSPPPGGEPTEPPPDAEEAASEADNVRKES